MITPNQFNQVHSHISTPGKPLNGDRQPALEGGVTPMPAETYEGVVSSEVVDVPFNGFLKYKTYDVSISKEGILERYRGGFVHGPGHHIAAVAAFAFDEAMTPHPILKTGDTRLSRAERKESYVLDGFIAGRMDHKGYDSSKIALAELAEEVGGEVVGQTFRKLGPGVTPTMPFESTESDNYYLAAVQLSGNPYGDGGGMEVVDLIGPKISAPLEALRSMDEGKVSEAGRTRVLFGRGFDQIGYIPQLGVYAQDHPELAKRFQTLGLGEVSDIRSQIKASHLPGQRPPADTLEAKINDAVTVQRREVNLDSGSRMVDAKTKHAFNDNGQVTAVGKEFPNQYLKLDYDRAKLATYYIDPENGPMVHMSSSARPALAFAPESPKVIRKDFEDVPISRDREALGQMPEGTRSLGQAGGASAGQSDLYYHFMAREVAVPENPTAEGFVPISQAIALCRSGEGDAQTEALCERLCDDLEWIPNLELSVSQARRLLTPSA